MGCGLTVQEKQRRLDQKRIIRINDDVMHQEVLDRMVKVVRNHGMKVGINDRPKKFILNFKNKDTKNLILALKREKAEGKGRLPDMDIVKIISVREPKDMVVRDFLIDHMPKRVGELHFDLKPKHKSKDFRYYQFELLKCFDKTLNSVYLNGLKINKGQLELTFKRCYKVGTLSFSHCILSDMPLMLEGRDSTASDNQKEKNIDYKISELEFHNCKNQDELDWDSNDQGFICIIEGILACQLKNSLEYIVVRGCGLSEKRTQNILNEYKLDIELITEVSDDSDVLGLDDINPTFNEFSQSKKFSSIENSNSNDEVNLSSSDQEDTPEEDTPEEDTPEEESSDYISF
ncbi:unnamed protein product [Moneuplotes crassus]|uniref:Uncharacterized protein n=1 Tax=Euplotes crassus TaxID=5936 RepID=A0AAD1XKK9_EUPCR|nr:unnamed protein product [Moneuplotes crassus]